MARDQMFFCASTGIALVVLLTACSSDHGARPAVGGAAGVGASTGGASSGGASSGGTSTGGVGGTSAGGSAGLGGAAAIGGTAGLAGSATGGSSATGGASGSGGATTGGAAGSGGASPTGGAGGTGGAGTGGAGTGGAGGTGGVATGGTSGTGGTGECASVCVWNDACCPSTCAALTDGDCGIIDIDIWYDGNSTVHVNPSTLTAGIDSGVMLRWHNIGSDELQIVKFGTSGNWAQLDVLSPGESTITGSTAQGPWCTYGFGGSYRIGGIAYDTYTGYMTLSCAN